MYAKTSNKNGELLQKLNWNKICCGTALSAVLTIILSTLWHEAFFQKEYALIGYANVNSASKNNMFTFSLFAAILQNFIHCFLYAMSKLISKSSVSLQFLQTWTIPLLGLYHWSFHVVAAAVNYQQHQQIQPIEQSPTTTTKQISFIESVIMFLLLETVYEATHFTIVASVCGFTV